MLTKRRAGWRWLSMGLATGLIVAVTLALACGPSAPVGQGNVPTTTMPSTPTATLRPDQLPDDITPSEYATLVAQPTATAFPLGYVRPTDVPTWTPIPPPLTLTAQIQQTAEAEAGAAGAQAPDPTDTAIAIQNRILEFLADQVALGEYDAIAHVQVTASRRVMVRNNGTDPMSELLAARRQTVTVIEQYRGTLPAEFDIISFELFRNHILDDGQEYIMAVYKFLIPESEYSSNEPWRSPYTSEALKVAGGEAYAYNVRMVWIVDDETARRVSSDYFHGMQPEYHNHMEAARGSAAELPLPTLATALRASSD